MAEKTIEQRVKNIIVEQLGVNADQVTPDAKFIEDLGADSLDTVFLQGLTEARMLTLDGGLLEIANDARTLKFRAE